MKRDEYATFECPVAVHRLGSKNLLLDQTNFHLELWDIALPNDERYPGLTKIRLNQGLHKVPNGNVAIPLAEEIGLILPIGCWVLESACAQLKAWQENLYSRDLILSINISAKQFHQADFVAQVQAALYFYAINPKLLRLELTESLLLENVEKTIAIMTTLSDIGVSFTLDDFGTGYSSLQYLKRLPLDELKIDQSFVQDITTDSSDKAIVSTIIAMAQILGLNVIAEGVETVDQRQCLINIPKAFRI